MKHFSQEEKEKQRTESHESRVERDFCLHNLENREEKENWFKESCKSRQERDLLSKNLENREEKEKWKYNSPFSVNYDFLDLKQKAGVPNPVSPCNVGALNSIV